MDGFAMMRAVGLATGLCCHLQYASQGPRVCMTGACGRFMYKGLSKVSGWSTSDAVRLVMVRAAQLAMSLC